MFEKCLSVVGGDENDGVLPPISGAQCREQLADPVVRRAKVAVVLRDDPVETAVSGISSPGVE